MPLHVQSRSRLFVDKWEQKWGMAFHQEKCTVLRVHRKRSPYIYDYTLKGHTQDPEECTKYLGVHISQNLSWNTHIDNITKKGNSTLLFISYTYKFVKCFLAITFLLLVISSWNFHGVCQRFLLNQTRNFSLIRQKMRNFPTDSHYKNCPLL